MLSNVRATLAIVSLCVLTACGSEDEPAVTSSTMNESNVPASAAPSRPDRPLQQCRTADEPTESWLAGSVEICRGKLIYRDYVYDDHGADTGIPGIALVSPAGNNTYPDGAGNTADLVSLQLSISFLELDIRAELNTLFDSSSTTLAVAIDTDNDPSTGGGQWENLSISSSGWDVLYTFSDGDPETNLIEGSVPLPEGEQWRVQAVVAQADGTVMNVAFRGTNEEAKCSLVDPAAGCFFEDLQAAALKKGDISEFAATVSVTDLLEGVIRDSTPMTPGFHQRVYVSDYTLPPGEGTKPVEGRGDGGSIPIKNQGFEFLGKYQPYAIYLPASGKAPYPLQMVFHGSGAVHGSQINLPGMQAAFGEGLGRILVSPAARGIDGFGSDISERDILDVMADVEANFDIDPDRVIASGTSQGGYISHRMASLYPQRFAGFITWVGFTGDNFNGLAVLQSLGLSFKLGAVGDITDLVGNLRNIPGVMLYGGTDFIVPPTSALAIRQAFLDSDNVYKWYFHPMVDHTGFMRMDEWYKEAVDSADFKRVKRPVRVSFRHDPNLGSPHYGIRHDRAYWVSDIRNRSVGDSVEEKVFGDIDLENFGCGGQTPIVTQNGNTGSDPAPWYSVEANRVSSTDVKAISLITGKLHNIASLTIDARETCNEGKPLRYVLVTDGPTQINMSDGRSIRLDQAGEFRGDI